MTEELIISILLWIISYFLVALFFVFFGNFVLPRKYKAKTFSKKWWFYVLFLIIMFFVARIIKTVDNPEIRSSLTGGIFLLMLGYLFRFKMEKILGDYVGKEKNIEGLSKWMGNSVLFLSFCYFFFAGLIYFMKIEIPGFWLWTIIIPLLIFGIFRVLFYKK